MSAALQPLRPTCRHAWVLYEVPRRHWWNRRRWRLFCHQCAGHAGGWRTKKEAIAHMLDSDWGRSQRW